MLFVGRQWRPGRACPGWKAGEIVAGDLGQALLERGRRSCQQARAVRGVKRGLTGALERVRR